jgi:6-phosphogluconolactonase (cycloisomerase 2 family)
VVPFAATRETAGPRHLAFHPKAALAYVVNGAPAIEI